MLAYAGMTGECLQYVYLLSETGVLRSFFILSDRIIFQFAALCGKVCDYFLTCVTLLEQLGWEYSLCLLIRLC